MPRAKKTNLPIGGSRTRTVVTAICALLGAIALGSFAGPALDQLYQGVSRVLVHSNAPDPDVATVTPKVRPDPKKPDGHKGPAITVADSSTTPPPTHYP